MQWQSSRKMSRPETSRIGFLGVLCSTEFSVHFLEINRKCRRHKEKKRKISAVFEVDKWSFSVDMKLRFCGWFLALGHHPKPQHHWAGTVPMTKFGISIFAKKTRKNIQKIMGLLGFSRFISLFIQILWFLGRKSDSFGGGGFDRSCGQPPRRISKFSASDKLGKLRLTLLFFAITIEQWLVDLGYLFIMFYLENYTDLIFRDVYQPWIQGFTSTTQGVYWNSCR